jgi:hypothetical protein
VRLLQVEAAAGGRNPGIAASAQCPPAARTTPLDLRWADRALFIWLYRLCPLILVAVTIVRSETLVRWHRMGFATTLGAPWIGLDWAIGLLVSTTTMIGDLFSSFTKRRMNLAPSSMALGLDQIPESLLPAIACRWVLPITVLDIVLVTALFFVGELVASRALYAFKIRDRPY